MRTSVSAGDTSEIKPALTKYGAKHIHGGSIRIRLPSMTLCPGCSQLRIYFLGKKIQLPAENLTKNIYFTLETICILKNPSSTDPRSLKIWLEGSKLNSAFKNSLAYI